MKILIFKTDIETDLNVNALSPMFQKHPNIQKWSVDTEDIDNVLRLEVSENLNENEIVSLVNSSGFCCEDLV